MAVTESTETVVGTSVKRKEDAALLRGARNVGREPDASGHGRDGRRPQPVRARAHREREPRCRPRRRRRRRRVQRRRPRGGLGRRHAVRLARHRGHQDAAALPAGDRRGPATRATASRSSSPRRARWRRTPPSSSRSTTSRSTPIADVAKALDDGAPLVHADLGTNECYVWKLETDDFQAAIDAADVVVTRRYFQPRLIPNAIEPRGVRRAGRARRRRHALVGDAGPAHPPLHDAARPRHPGVEGAGHRPRRRRRLRLEAQRLRGGVPRRRARQAARPAR